MTIKLNATYKKGTRVKKVVAIGLNEEYYGGSKEVVIYAVKDGSTRYETKESFEKWITGAEII